MDGQVRIAKKSRKLWRYGVVLFVAIVFFSVNGVGFFLGNKVFEEASVLHTRPNRSDSAQLKARLERGKEQLGWQDITLTSPFGYPLQGTFIPNSQPSTKTIIFLHGFTGSRLDGLGYARVYLNAGFNFLMIDSRRHGDSGGDSVSWGVYEKDDLDQWIGWLQQRFPHGQIGVHGISMGAATALLHAAKNNQNDAVSFYIADSSFDDFDALLREQIRQRLPQLEPQLSDLLLVYANLAAYWHGRFLYYDASPLRIASQIHTPVLYLHGEADKLIPVAMSRTLYERTGALTQLVTFPAMDHIQAAFQVRREYWQTVENFIALVPKTPR
ncbi:MAG: alpha/beta fold hydrolase [Sporomusaceae bacterium]|nr:alpha/beta fold hydrolase [Sporomusaceae bacterium]